jgi:hypothetical protein
MGTRAEQVYMRVHELMDTQGINQSDACRAVAEETGLQFNSVRGAYQSHRSKLAGGTSRPKRRETTPDDAVADAIKTLERALENIDREVEQAGTRAREATEEAKAQKASAADRKAAIQQKIDALSS